MATSYQRQIIFLEAGFGAVDAQQLLTALQNGTQQHIQISFAGDANLVPIRHCRIALLLQQCQQRRRIRSTEHHRLAADVMQLLGGDLLNDVTLGDDAVLIGNQRQLRQDVGGDQEGDPLLLV